MSLRCAFLERGTEATLGASRKSSFVFRFFYYYEDTNEPLADFHRPQNEDDCSFGPNKNGMFML